MAENILNKTFKNSSEIDEFFKTLNSNGFVDWFNKNHSMKAAFVSNAEIKSTEDFSKFFSNIKKFLGKDEINLVEFICVSTFVIVETFSSFKPIIEKVGDNSNPGISYAYNAINGIKLSYNNNTLIGNKTAFDLFNDPDYVLAHSHKPYGNILRRTTDTRWQSTQFPLGFSGNPEKETSTNLADNTFLAEADFNKFRGRGYVKTLGRINYIDLIKYIEKYTGTNPKIISYKAKWTNYGANYDLIASISSNFDWNDLFKNSNLEIPCIAINLDSINNGNYLIIDANQSEQNLDKAIRNVAANINDTALYIQSFLSKVKQLINSINNTVPPESGEQNIGGTASQPPQQEQQEAIVEQAREDDKNDINSQNKSEDGNTQKVTGLTNFFKPTIEVKHIDFELDSKNKQKTDEAISSTGYLPFVWYSGIQLEHNYIQSLQISSVGLLPTLNMVFADQYGQFGFEDNGFPLDDSKIKIFIASRTKVLKPVLMDFKIKKFKRLAENLYSIEGIADINYMFLKRFESYSQKTSFEAMQEFARRASLGFNSNIDNTNDKMSRINPGVSGIDFVSSVVSEAYKSDDAFLWAYVDFYYNLNYLDVETALNTDVQGVGNVQNMGLEALSKLNVSNNEDVTKMILSNDKSYSSMNLYFSDYKIINKSTDISLAHGYMNRVKFYDILNTEYNVFDIDTITSAGDKSIIMKGSPQDDAFFAEHIDENYLGKIDSDNMHRNYNYAFVQNRQNIFDIQKIGIEIKLPIPNFNLYRFQKVAILFNADTPTVTSTDKNNRLSGEWLVLTIKFVQNGNNLEQVVTLIKRELDLSRKEFEAEPKAQSSNNSENVGTKNDESDQNTGIQDEPQPEQPQAAPIAHGANEKFKLTTLFNNSSSIDSYFTKYGNTGFADWFNKNMAFKGPFSKQGGNADRSIVKPENWAKIWNTIESLYGKKECNLLEFLCLNTIMINETGGKFAPKAEGVNSVSKSTHPGIAYAFDSGGKKSYNTLETNKTAYDLFRDADYKAAHSQKPFGNILKDTTDLRWKGTQFPVGFSGAGNIQKEVSTNASDNGFIAETDFFKYRGRGYIQLTGRKNYQGLVEYILKYTGSNKIILSYKSKWIKYSSDLDKILTISTNADWDDLFNNTDSIIASRSIFEHAKSKYQIIDANKPETEIQKSIRNVASKVAGAGAKDYIELFQNRVNTQIDWLEKNTK